MTVLTAPAQLAEKLTTAERFHRLAAEWKQESLYLSNLRQAAMLPSYQRIIGMGLPVVPLILEDLARDPVPWFWALEAITEANPVPPDVNGDMKRITEAWLDWGRREGLLV